MILRATSTFCTFHLLTELYEITFVLSLNSLILRSKLSFHRNHPSFFAHTSLPKRELHLKLLCNTATTIETMMITPATWNNEMGSAGVSPYTGSLLVSGIDGKRLHTLSRIVRVIKENEGLSCMKSL